MTRIIRLAALLCLALPLAAGAQQGAQITPNYKDADLGQVIEAVSQVTGRHSSSTRACARRSRCSRRRP
jgi:type II secretory pathway component GspD/PulD (secretin)